MKKNSPRQYGIAFWQATRGLKGADLGLAISNFVALLARERMIKKSDEVIRSFIQYAKEQDGVEDIEIISAHPLSDKVINSIKNIFGNKVDAIQKTDASLIGGVIIRTRDKILDASIKSQLNKLKQSLI
ncbi:MAG: ATP synthase F1 subunit delta [Candidatus Magasanikbacteria bacterium]|nr:ATP synthase F1 subunit delta [Candidatus Magasanikbacteria bacterium]